MPTISIITAVRNGNATITDCLQSVRSQAHAVEHVIIDGCSTDNTLELALKTSPEAHVLSEPDSGIYDAMNKGLALATGDIIGILNADDIYSSPEVLSKVSAAFVDQKIDACYGDLVYMREVAGNGQGGSDRGVDSRPWDSSSTSFVDIHPRFQVVRYWKAGKFHPDKFYWGWMPPHPTFFVRRTVYERFGSFDLSLGTAADYESMLRFLLKHRIATAYIPETLVWMRVGGASNATIKARLAANRNDRLAWKVNGLKPYLWTTTLKPIRKIPQFFCRP